MNRAARLGVVLVTAVSVACSGRACAGTSSTPASQSTASAVPAGTRSDESGAERSAGALREPLVRAQQELATALGNPTDPDRLSVTDLTTMIERLLTEAEASERALPRETFDAGAVARRVGPDPVTLFAWVRDQTNLVPYRGVLRGSAGVLMDRLGNSLDRALLLADLLRAAGATARLAHGTLSRDQALSLAQRSGAVPTRRPTSPRSSPTDDAAAVATYASAHRLDEARLRAATDRMSVASQSLAQGFQQRVERQSTEIAAALNRSASLPADASADVEALRDHWWVQVQQGAQWLDLDPTAPDAAPGRAPVDAAEVLAPTDLPRNLYHEVVIRVVVERWSAGRLQESTALEHPLRPLDLVGQRILLQQAPLNWPANLDLSGDPAQAAPRLTAALLAQKEWLPTLTIGANRPITQASVTDAGNLNTTPGAARPAKPPAGFGGLLDAFGGGDADPAPEPAGHLTAEWIDYEIRSPGRPATRIRRDVFDLLGPAARTGGQIAEPNLAGPAALPRAMALAGDTELLLLASHLSPEFTAHVVNTAVLNQRDTLRGVLRDAAAGRGPSVDQTAKLNSMSGELHALAISRTTLSPVKDRVFLDRPNVFSFHRRFRPGPSGTVVFSKSLDIVTNDVAVRSTAGTDAFNVRLAQGVADTAAEALILTGGCSGCSPVANVSELRVSTQEAPWVPIRRLDDPAWRQVALTQDARRRAEDDVRAGYVVFVPPRPVQATDGNIVGWWRVDPRSGSTLGIMESGHGQGMVELVILLTAATLAIGGACAWSCGAFDPSKSPTKRSACLLCCTLLGGFIALAFFFVALVGPAAGAVAWFFWGLTGATGATCGGIAFFMR